MKKATIIVLTGLVFLSFACSSQNIKSIKVEEPIAIDGDGTDWEKYPLAFNEDFNFIYGALNTETDLFLMFRFNDSQLAHMLSIRGGTIWIGKEKHFGIHYIDESLRDFMPDSPKQLARSSGRGKRFQPAGIFSIVGQDSIWSPDIEQYPSIDAGFKMIDGLYCFEIKIPYKYKSDFKFLNKNPGEEIEIGFELAAIDENMKKQMDEQMKQGGHRGGGMSSGGMTGRGRPGGRGPGGGRGGGRSPGNMKMDFEAKIVWFDITLAE